MYLKKPPQRQQGNEKSARRLSIEYSVALVLSYLIAAMDAAAILIPLGGRRSDPPTVDFAEKNLALILLLVVVAIVGVAVAGAMSLRHAAVVCPRSGATTAEREVAIKLAGRQTAILLIAWGVSARS